MKGHDIHSPYTLITGGAGFIGTNLAHFLAMKGRRVLVYDDLSRPGVQRNLLWLKETHGDLIKAVIGDLRNTDLITPVIKGAESIFHLAAQVAVTKSMAEPIEDFEINALGTLKLLEAIRKVNPRVPFIFTSTNKVFGNLEDLSLKEVDTRFIPTESGTDAHGISEARGIEFCSPYGCSKGAADQYVLDYSKHFGIRGCVFRMSCIYGPHQFGNEDQGWIAHFLIQALDGKAITFYGNGKQVRDALYVDDLLSAFSIAEQKIDQLSGQAFNIGGGPENTLSLVELVDQIEVLADWKRKIYREDWRPSDQRYYVSDIRKFQSRTGWQPKISVCEGIIKLWRWLEENRSEHLSADKRNQSRTSAEGKREVDYRGIQAG